jgi:hypothetical protein
LGGKISFPSQFFENIEDAMKKIFPKLLLLTATAAISSGLLSTNAFGRQTIAHNTLEHIDSCEAKIKLTLIRTWGGDETDDENQFFRYPMDIKISNEGLVHIVDTGNNRIQVFDRASNYKKTVGRKGKGPQDLLKPCAITFVREKDLVVAESDNHRIQTFDSVGRYLHSFKTINTTPSLIATTRKNEIAAYSYKKSYKSRTFVTLYTPQGKTIREIGKIHDNKKSISSFESLLFALDENDNFYISYYATPYYRKYTYDGKPAMIVTYQVPFEAPGVCVENPQEEPIIKGQKKGKVCTGLSIDHRGRVFLVTTTRRQKKSERFFLVSDGPGMMRKCPKDAVSENTDWFRLLVFDPGGKVIAAKKLNVFCDKIYVYEDSLFIIDTYMGMKIYEYKISFDE